LDEPKNYRAIMLSSTFTDLRDHRQRAIEAISKLGYMPRVMEHTGARADADVIESSLSMVRDSAAYVGVISSKYGQTPVDSVRNPDQLSITELEFNEAVRLKRPIVLFIMGDEHPVKKADVETDPNKRKKLDAFRECAKRMHGDSEVQRIYETFDSLEQFSHGAAIAIGNLVQHLERSVTPKKTEEGRPPRGALSNIPINVPRHFLGRNDDLAAIDTALKSNSGRAAITALHGLRGVGKTTLAAAYAEAHRNDFRATWWIKGETESTMRADLVGLGVRLGWVAADAVEGSALAAVLERLRDDGDGVLLIYDNANSPGEIEKYLPRGGAARIIVTSNAPNWGGTAAPVEIEVWPAEIGADYLIARTGRSLERAAALALSEALGGLPLAHEQAAAYCERIGVSLAEYHRRFEAAPAKLLDDVRDASRDYHDGLTVAKTFALAIDEAAKLHPAAEPLIVYAAMLAPEPIPLFLFSEAREKIGEPLASALAGDGLDEAVAVLRTFALLDRESIPDEREPEITTDCIRLHRLIRQVAAVRLKDGLGTDARRSLVAAVAQVYPDDVDNPNTWPRIRRLDALGLALVGNSTLLDGAEEAASHLMDRLAKYRQSIAAYDQARLLFEQALGIDEKVFGPDHPNTAASLNNLAILLEDLGDFQGSRPLKARALAIEERTFGPDHPRTAIGINNLGYLLQAQGDYVGARPYFERALLIREKALGPDHPDTGASLNNLGYVLQAQGDLDGARAYYERALSIFEKVLGLNHPHTAISFNNLGGLLDAQGDLDAARPYYERALSIREKALGPDHPDTAGSLNNLGGLLLAQGDFAAARPYFERALAVFDKVLGAAHPTTKIAAGNTAGVLEELKHRKEAKALREKFGI